MVKAEARFLEHTCSACGFLSPRWFGRCPDCGGWNSATPRIDAAAPSTLGSLASVTVPRTRITTGFDEVDRVLGGGLVPGEVVLLAGAPGIGKSTLVLQIAAAMTGGNRRCLLATGEESLEQVALRAARVGADVGDCLALATSSLEEILATAVREAPDVVIVDSIQTIVAEKGEGLPGAVTQVRGAATALVQYAKQTGTCILAIGHITKDGSVAGPKVLEHVVDCVVTFEGQPGGSLRFLRTVKNRFGPTDEVGVLEMTAGGLEGVPDASALFLEQRLEASPGSAVFPMVEGSRPLLVEVQALVAKSDLAQPRRVSLAFPSQRLSMLLAVLDERARVEFPQLDIFVATAGGLALKEPAADLAVCAALTSARYSAAIDPRTAYIGEVGLGGEVRAVPGLERRLRECARLGFEDAFVPCQKIEDVGDLRLVRVRRVADALPARP